MSIETWKRLLQRDANSHESDSVAAGADLAQKFADYQISTSALARGFWRSGNTEFVAAVVGKLMRLSAGSVRSFGVQLSRVRRRRCTSSARLRSVV